MRIALLGFGLEARSAYEFLRKKYPLAEFEVYDQNQECKLKTPPEAEVFLGVNDFSQIDADILVRTPAVSPKDLPSNARVTTVTNLFFEHCPAPIIGVTGSKGKGTTSSFIAEILRAAGFDVHLVGNIGVPALDKLDKISAESVVVCEMSSFQLWDLEKAPHIAVMTNIEPDHLDVHDDMDDYIWAKSNIAFRQISGDFFIYNQANQIVDQVATKVRKISATNLQPFPNRELAHVEQGDFFWGEQRLFSTNILKLVGRHNQENALAAMIASYDFLNEKKVKFTDIVEAWRAGLSKFDGLPHRLKFVRSVGGVDFYDDSIATTQGSALAALAAFDQPKILIIGGSDKGADMGELIDQIVARHKFGDLRNVILIGEQAVKIADQLRAKNFNKFIELGLKTDMDQIVDCAFAVSLPGDVVILSPAHASLDMFKSYVDRGEKFIAAVRKL